MKEKRRDKRIWIRVTDEEYNLILKNSEHYKSSADYMRSRIFGRGKALLNPIEFIRSIDDVSLEMKRIGNNINQFAKYANQRRNVDGELVIKEYNKLLSEYVKVEKKLEVLYRKIISL